MSDTQQVFLLTYPQLASRGAKLIFETVLNPLEFAYQKPFFEFTEREMASVYTAQERLSQQSFENTRIVVKSFLAYLADTSVISEEQKRACPIDKIQYAALPS